MDEGKKKQLLVKMKAVCRTLKEHKSYKQQVDNFDLTEVNQDKKKAEFYNESLMALEMTKKSVIEFTLQAQNFLDENKQDIQEIDDAATKA